MDLVQLKYFVNVVELQSITRAASALHVAQPAISRQIRALEDELGVTLLYRYSRGVEATEAGVRLLERARVLLRLAAETRLSVQAATREVTGTVRVGFPPSVGASLIARVAAKFRLEYPMANVNLLEGYSVPLRDGLLSDNLDLAVLTDPRGNPLLRHTPLYRESLWAFYLSGARHPGRQSSGPLRLEDLRNVELIMPGPANRLRDTLDRAIQEIGLSLNVIVQSESLAVTRVLLMRGIGVHVSPYTALEQDIVSGNLDGRQIGDLWVTRVLVRRVDRPLTLAQQKFIETLENEVQALVKRSNGMILESE